MLGEKRSRAAFQGDSSGSVQDGRGAYAEKPETGNVPLGYKEAGQKGTGRDGSGNAPAGYEKTGQAGTKDVPGSSTGEVNFPESSSRIDMHIPTPAGEAYLDGLLEGRSAQMPGSGQRKSVPPRQRRYGISMPAIRNPIGKDLLKGKNP